MSDNIVSLDQTKQIKKVIDDLETCLSLLDLNIKSFRPYVKYKPVSEIYSVLETNKNIIEIHLNKYKRKLNA